MERREKRYGSWKKDATVTAPSTVYTVEGLVEGVEYYFRVSAENEEGPSEPTELAQPVKATKEPSKNVFILSISQLSVSIIFIRPFFAITEIVRIF